MEGVGRRDDDRVKAWIGQHGVVVAERLLWRIGGGHPVEQIGSDVANRVELRVLRLDGALEMRRLSDRAATQDADPKPIFVL